jgi:hypothetical protein
VLARFFDAAEWTAFNGRLGWTDLDSLVIGNGPASGLSDDERRTTMTLWSIVGSPLYVGNDLSTLDETGLSLLSNDEVIAVDQAGTGGRPEDNRTDEQVWYKLLPDGSYAVAPFNLGASAAPVTGRWSDVSFCGIGLVTDLWSPSHPQARRDGITVTLASHASALYKVRPLPVDRCPAPPAPPAAVAWFRLRVQYRVPPPQRQHPQSGYVFRLCRQVFRGPVTRWLRRPGARSGDRGDLARRSAPSHLR